MPYAERQIMYRRISELRERPLIVYVTSSRLGASAQMSADVIPQFARLLNDIPAGNDAIDILIVSNGGDPMVSWRVMSMVRERFKRVGVLLPFAAYSAATLLALGANDIVMHPFSNLGPVDPQLTHRRRVPGQQGGGELETIQFGSEDLRYFLDFVRKDVGISDQDQLEKAFELICKEVGAIPIGVAKRSTQLALALSEQLLRLHVEDNTTAHTIAEALNRSFYHHGYALGRTEAKRIGLPVVNPEPELEEVLWAVWRDLEEEMQCNTAFNPLEHVLNSSAAGALFSPVPLFQLPANLPPPMQVEAFQSMLQRVSVIQVPPIDFSLFVATLECEWCRSEFKQTGKMLATRMPDMNLSVNMIQIAAGWTFVGAVP